MTTIDKNKLIEALDQIEDKESELLAWGDVEVFSSRDEIESSLKSVGVAVYYVDDYFNALIQRCFVFPIGDDCYRTRMAETVRLQVLSRQWFAKQNVEDAKPLISDFRFLKRPRQYPKRDNDAQALIEGWEQKKLFQSPNEKAILSSLLKNGNNWFQLSGFQVRSTERILSKYEHHRRKRTYHPSATIVCAGTGSGKTLSFYLPAMTKLATDLINDDSGRVRILAIYPRKELLKDQFSETYREARKLDDFLSSKGKRKITIGTFYGGTFSEHFAKDGQVFEPMVCPQGDCGGILKFNQQSKETVCSSCQVALSSDEVVTTREGVTKNPPDILFTTTEMLNQRLSDRGFNHLFGVNDSNIAIPLVLLDEVHTYEGSTGAQTSFLLKRWMAFSGIKPHFVGLSATLADAKNFFADLTGTLPQHTELIESFEREIEEEGAEYLLALRGDPASQTGLLSATIQATMLGSRMLDCHVGNNRNISQDVFGQKAFVFTDDLDVINRLYNDYLDAEGKQDFFGQLRPSNRNENPLAYLRSPSNENCSPTLKRELGQDWFAAEKIGHYLDQANIVERTSSQDSGVNQGANVVVATASLEVGYNDPTVGAVIQHKAPRNVASYLQRKGRAGRRRGMRPWMYTILSDFGRDRIAFQQYEQLIDPKVSTTKLPTENSHIHKMHAALTTLEWLVKNSPQLKWLNVWSALKAPQKNAGKLEKLHHAVVDLLSTPSKIDQLTAHIKSTLGLNDDQAKVVMWAPPRSIMMSFLPELEQSLKYCWGVKGQHWYGVGNDNSGPMPKYIAAQLFSELNTQGLSIILDRSTKNEVNHKREDMAFFQALKEFSPGRMSKRYTVKAQNVPDWLVPVGFEPVPGQKGNIAFDIESAFGDVNKQVLQDYVNHNGEQIPVYQPRFINTTHSMNKALTNKSSSMLQWHFDIREPTVNHTTPVPQSSEWFEVLKSINFYTHDNSSPIELTRFCTGAKASIPFAKKGQDAANVFFQWQQNNSQVAVGTKLWVDSAKFGFEFTDEKVKQLLFHNRNKQALYYQYLHETFLNAEPFEHEYFLANWIFECVMSALFVICSERKLALHDALEVLHTVSGKQLLLDVVNGMFQRRNTEMGDEEQDLHQRLSEYFEDDVNMTVIRSALDLDPNYDQSQSYFEWGKNVLGQTLCGGIHAMFLKLVSDVSEQSFNLDHRWDGSKLNIWMNENEVGGIGYITKFREAYREDPLRTLGYLSHAFETGEYEQVNFDLQHFLLNLMNNQALQQGLDDVRTSSSLEARSQATKALKLQISRLGILPSHAWNSILYSRVLKKGANSSTDQHLIKLLKEWDGYESCVDIEIPLHIMSYLASRNSGGTPGDIYRYKNRVQSQLWQRGAMIREQELGFYNPFNTDQNKTERLLLTRVITSKDVLVDFDNQGTWRDMLSSELKSSGKCILVFNGGDRSQIKTVLSELNVSMIEYNKMIFYPRITKVQARLSAMHLTVEVRDILQ
ncbi:protein DpdJ [Vibrio atlanticus]|uniref:protein DpdJ n=1 Tax=Vibrio atlanticus TaxID=693153 RepID=UPI000EFBFA85|nr:protein DpdJ [Vibrio atlanticus]